MPNTLSNQEMSAGQHADTMANYMHEGGVRDLRFGNSGSIKLDAAGKLEQGILEAYLEDGFYVYENVVEQDELEELRSDVERVACAECGCGFFSHITNCYYDTNLAFLQSVAETLLELMRDTIPLSR